MIEIPAVITARAVGLLAELSTAEKLALLAGDTPFWSGMVDIALGDASHSHPWPAGALPRLGLEGLQFVDGPWGVVLKGGATTFPVPMARGASWNPDLEQRIGEAIALEARSFGANWVAAVCVNLLRHPGWGRAQETYGEDPVHVGAMGAACTRGLERHAIACVKHFALNSIDRGLSNLLPLRGQPPQPVMACASSVGQEQSALQNLPHPCGHGATEGNLSISPEPVPLERQPITALPSVAPGRQRQHPGDGRSLPIPSAQGEPGAPGMGHRLDRAGRAQGIDRESKGHIGCQH